MAKVRRPINAPKRGLPKAFSGILILAVAAIAYYFGTASSDRSADGDNAETASVGDDGNAYALPTAAYGPEDAPAVLAKWTDFQ